jgi:hypothetical protein
MTSLGNPRVEALLARLHAQSEGQDPELGQYFMGRAKAGDLD